MFDRAADTGRPPNWDVLEGAVVTACGGPAGRRGREGLSEYVEGATAAAARPMPTFAATLKPTEEHFNHLPPSDP